MQYTIRRIPQTVDSALRKRARNEGKSLNAVAVEALARDAGVEEAATDFENAPHGAGLGECDDLLNGGEEGEL